MKGLFRSPEGRLEAGRSRTTAAKATTSEARARASRRNGARSRGPITAAGKARSARNALKHGLRARNLTLLPDEDAAGARDVGALPGLAELFRSLAALKALQAERDAMAALSAIRPTTKRTQENVE